MMKELVELRKANRRFKNKLKERTYEEIESLRNKDIQTEGIILQELASKCLCKHIGDVSDKDKKLIYRMILEYRKERSISLICLDRKYGFTDDEELIRLYSSKRLDGAMGMICSTQKFMEAESRRLGYDLNARKMIENKFEGISN